MEREEIIRVFDLAGGMTLQAQKCIVLAHAVTVIGHLDESFAALLYLDKDFVSTGVEGIFYQLLDDRRGSLNDFTGGDLVG